MEKKISGEIKSIETCFNMVVLHKCNKCKGLPEVNKQCENYSPMLIDIPYYLNYTEFIELEIEQREKEETTYIDYRKLSN